MRAVFLGASSLALMTARQLLEREWEVVIIEQDQSRIDELSDDIDCGFLLGDGSRPAVLEEVGPDKTDILFAMSDSDQDNIIGSLVARSLGVKRVVTRIEDADFEGVCRELGLHDTIVPDHQVAGDLADMAEGIDRAPLTGALRKGLRFFTLAVTEKLAGPISDLELPESSRVIAVTRDGESRLADGESAVGEKDQLLLVVREEDLESLVERFTDVED